MSNRVPWKYCSPYSRVCDNCSRTEAVLDLREDSILSCLKLADPEKQWEYDSWCLAVACPKCSKRWSVCTACPTVKNRFETRRSIVRHRLYFHSVEEIRRKKKKKIKSQKGIVKRTQSDKDKRDDDVPGDSMSIHDVHDKSDVHAKVGVNEDASEGDEKCEEILDANKDEIQEEEDGGIPTTTATSSAFDTVIPNSPVDNPYDHEETTEYHDHEDSVEAVPPTPAAIK